MISRLAGSARSTVASTIAVSALAPNASSTPIQIERSRSRWPVLRRNATTAPIDEDGLEPLAQDDEERLQERAPSRWPADG